MPVPKADKHVHGMWSKCGTSFVHNIPSWAKQSLTRHRCCRYTKNVLCKNCQ